MIIEQYLMRTLKTSGGLTQGRVITSSTVGKWVKTMPATTKIVESVEKLSGDSSVSSDQHVELRESRIGRDSNDALKLTEWLKLHNPFERDSSGLVSLHNRLVALATAVNCDSAKETGTRSINQMVGKPFNEVHLTRKDVVVTLETGNKGIRIRDQLILK